MRSAYIDGRGGSHPDLHSDVGRVSQGHIRTGEDRSRARELPRRYLLARRCRPVSGLSGAIQASTPTSKRHLVKNQGQRKEKNKERRGKFRGFLHDVRYRNSFSSRIVLVYRCVFSITQLGKAQGVCSFV